jgi:hypothetical protein
MRTPPRPLKHTRTAAVGARPPRRPSLGAISLFQPRTNTTYNGYPPVFARAAAIVSQPAERDRRVLSFGCSTGEEPRVLAECYFTADDDLIIGVDANPNVLRDARVRNASPRVRLEGSDEGALGKYAPYHAIFAMSVFCAWPETKTLDDCGALFPFDAFSKAMAALDSVLAPRGVLVVYNANFCFGDTDVSRRYHVPQQPLSGSGFVKKFRRDNNAFDEGHVYPSSVFVKL